MEKIIIYGLRCSCHPEDGIRYVGQTIKGATARFGIHRWNANQGTKMPVYNWMRKHGVENIIMQVLEVSTLENIDEREVFWINHHREIQGVKLMNVELGGHGARGHKRTPEQRAAIGGKNNPMYGTKRAEIAAYARSFNKPWTDERRRERSESQRGRKHTEETRKKMSVSAKAAITPAILEARAARVLAGNNPGAKLNVEKVREIRSLFQTGLYTYKDIGDMYNVTGGNISNIIRRKSWNSVD